MHSVSKTIIKRLRRRRGDDKYTEVNYDTDPGTPDAKHSAKQHPKAAELVKAALSLSGIGRGLRDTLQTAYELRPGNVARIKHWLPQVKHHMRGFGQRRARKRYQDLQSQAAGGRGSQLDANPFAAPRDDVSVEMSAIQERYPELFRIAHPDQLDEWWQPPTTRETLRNIYDDISVGIGPEVLTAAGLAAGGAALKTATVIDQAAAKAFEIAQRAKGRKIAEQFLGCAT